MMLCVDCGMRDAFTRGVCRACYSKAIRNEDLDRFPTKAFEKDPESHIRWAFSMHPDLVKDIAVEYGFRVV